MDDDCENIIELKCNCGCDYCCEFVKDEPTDPDNIIKPQMIDEIFSDIMFNYKKK